MWKVLYPLRYGSPTRGHTPEEKLSPSSGSFGRCTTPQPEARPVNPFSIIRARTSTGLVTCRQPRLLGSTSAVSLSCQAGNDLRHCSCSFDMFCPSSVSSLSLRRRGTSAPQLLSLRVLTVDLAEQSSSQLRSF